MSRATGQELVNFIQENKLDDVPILTEFVEGLVFSVYLDDAHADEIEYTWSFKGNDIINRILWQEDEDGDFIDSTEEALTSEEALRLRGLG